ncbi:MAG: MG2 domain-containing protein, partial [Arenimonas sp.]
EYALEIPGLAAMRGELAIRLRPGLRAIEGPLPGDQEKLLARLRVGEPFRLRTVACADGLQRWHLEDVGTSAVKLGACTPETPINLSFSRALDDAGVATLVAALPSGWIAKAFPPNSYGSYYVDPKKVGLAREAHVMLTPIAGTAAFSLHLPNDVTSRDGDRLDATPPVELSIAHFKPTVSVTPDVLRVRVGDTIQPTATGRNYARELALERVSIGARAQHDRAIARARGKPDEPAPLSLPPTPASVRDSGGLALVGARDVPHFAYAIAYAPFDVVVRDATAGKALVWASRWGEARGLADAQVELLAVDESGQETIAARSRTDVGGLAWLDVPKEVKGDGLELGWLVRVTQGGQRTVSPLRQGRLDQTGSPHNWHYPNKDLLAFGVTDRVLYRPGETVRYRVWWRRQDDNHLVATPAPARLQLHFMDKNKALKDWPVVADALGGMAGEVALPRLLDDGTYCVTPAGEVQNVVGACFEVARFEAQPVWSQLKADREVVMAGDTLVLDAEAGFFSGGPAPGALLAFSGILQPRSPGEVFSAFARYTFAPLEHRESQRALGDATPPDRTDANGQARLRYTVPDYRDTDSNDPIDFGVLEVSVGASAAGRATASSAPVTVNYARYPRYVGLAILDWWLAMDADPKLDAVVISAKGEALADVPVQVRIEKSNSPWSREEPDEDGNKTVPEVVGRCTLVSGKPAPCGFRAPAEGWYRFIVGSEGAAPTEMVRWVGSTVPVEDGKKPLATLELLRAADGDVPARVRVRQP